MVLSGVINFVVLSEVCYGRSETPCFGVSSHPAISFTAAPVDATTIDFKPRPAVLARSRWRASVLLMVLYVAGSLNQSEASPKIVECFAMLTVSTGDILCLPLFHNRQTSPTRSSRA